MGTVRPFTKNDIPQVVNLHARVFLNSGHPPPQYFEEVFFSHPGMFEDISSLVYEEGDQINGFLGVVPRRLTLQGKPLVAAYSSHLMVDPARRSTMAAFELLKRYLAGSQDVSIGDTVNEAALTVGKACKCEAVWAYNMQWSRPLRPVPVTRLHALVRRVKRERLVPMARRLASVFDGLAERKRGTHLRPLNPNLATMNLSEDAMLAAWPQVAGGCCLRPAYDSQLVKWLLKRAEAKTRYGCLMKVGVLDKSQELVGWYLYYSKPGQRALVLQIAAKPNLLSDVLDSLFHHAWERGAAAVYGRLEPRFMPAFSSRQNMDYQARPDGMMMVYSKNRQLLAAIHRGDAFLSQLDGEQVIGWHGERYEN
jgi:hypothetical protein